MSTTEQWRPIPGFPGYEASSLGRIKSYRGRQPRVLRPGPHRGGYGLVCLQRGPEVAPRTVHSLVAAAFYGPRPDGLQVRHLDGNPANNCVDNLRYGTRSENMRDTLRHGTHPKASKTHCPDGHPYSGENLLIDRSSGGRRCRICRTAQNRASKIRRALRAAGVAA